MKRIIIAGGGTGGHIYPGIAVAQAIKKLDSTADVHFVGTEQGLEAKIVPREGFSLHFIKISGLNRVSLLGKIKTILLLPLALLQSFRLVQQLRPQVILGVGGYSSGPLLLAGIFLKIPCYLFEPNAHPGLTNRWLARFVKMAFVNFESSKVFFSRAEVVGIPVREAIEILATQPRVVHAKPLRVLVFGGSQGARGINTVIAQAIQAGQLGHAQIVHQIGHNDFAALNETYKKMNPPNLQWFEFLYDMPERLQWADVAICRSGASTLAELAASRLPAILVPFPGATDNHQQRNAEAFVKKQAALLVLQKDLTVDRVVELIADLEADQKKLKSMSAALVPFFMPQTARHIAEKLLHPRGA